MTKEKTKILDHINRIDERVSSLMPVTLKNELCGQIVVEMYIKIKESLYDAEKKLKEV